MSFDDFLKVASFTAVIAGIVISLATFIKTLLEYIKQGKLKRAENFSNLEIELWQNPSFKKIAILLTAEEPNQELQNIDLQDKFVFLAFIEKIALMLNSGLISKDIAHYMFGYISIACYDNEAFWNDDVNLNKNDPYWSLFCDFCIRMKKVEKTFRYSRKKLKF
ncbi:MAG: hypothetical protein NTX45_22925 [Proteobacteria bacterium]|nr:hypothetical protein [Pseudomonadota bacterium]